MEEFLFSDDDSFKNNHFDVKIPGWKKMANVTTVTIISKLLIGKLG